MIQGRAKIRALIVIVASIGCVGGHSMKAMTQIRMLEAALEAFRMDNGRYPTTDEGLSALVTPPPALQGSSTYPTDGYLREHRVPKDPWGNPFEYRSTPVHNTEGFDLWSLGGDGRPGGAGIDADLGNWPGGFAEHEALDEREHRLHLLLPIELGIAVGAALGFPVYLFGIITAARGRRTWRSALVGGPLAVMVCLVTVCTIVTIVSMFGFHSID